jgi:hypothetical protein
MVLIAAHRRKGLGADAFSVPFTQMYASFKTEVQIKLFTYKTFEVSLKIHNCAIDLSRGAIVRS